MPDPEAQPRTRAELLERRTEILKQKAAQEAYLDEVVRPREDWHGVADAAAELRDMTAELWTIAWMLGEDEDA